MSKRAKRKMKVFDKVMGNMRNQPLGKYSNISVTDYERKRKKDTGKD